MNTNSAIKRLQHHHYSAQFSSRTLSICCRHQKLTKCIFKDYRNSSLITEFTGIFIHHMTTYCFRGKTYFTGKNNLARVEV